MCDRLLRHLKLDVSKIALRQMKQFQIFINICLFVKRTFKWHKSTICRYNTPVLHLWIHCMANVRPWTRSICCFRICVYVKSATSFSNNMFLILVHCAQKCTMSLRISATAAIGMLTNKMTTCCCFVAVVVGRVSGNWIVSSASGCAAAALPLFVHWRRRPCEVSLSLSTWWA